MQGDNILACRGVLFVERTESLPPVGDVLDDRLAAIRMIRGYDIQYRIWLSQLRPLMLFAGHCNGSTRLFRRRSLWDVKSYSHNKFKRKNRQSGARIVDRSVGPVSR